MARRQPPYRPWTSPGFMLVLLLVGMSLCMAFGWLDEGMRFVSVLWGWIT